MPNLGRPCRINYTKKYIRFDGINSAHFEPPSQKLYNLPDPNVGTQRVAEEFFQEQCGIIL